jgi:hypothetical protein
LAWFLTVEPQLRVKLPLIKVQRSEVNSELIDPPCHGASVSFSTEGLLGSFSVWDRGMCEVIFMDNTTAESIVLVDRHFAVSEDLIKVLDHVVQLLLSGASFEKLKTEPKELEEAGAR